MLSNDQNRTINLACLRLSLSKNIYETFEWIISQAIAYRQRLHILGLESLQSSCSTYKADLLMCYKMLYNLVEVDRPTCRFLILSDCAITRDHSINIEPQRFSTGDA